MVQVKICDKKLIGVCLFIFIIKRKQYVRQEIIKNNIIEKLEILLKKEVDVLFLFILSGIEYFEVDLL